MPQPQDEPAFLCMPEPFQILSSEPCVLPDGTVPSSFTTIFTEWCLGAEISPLHSQSVPQSIMKVLGYDLKGDAQAITNATKGQTLEKKAKEIDVV